MGLDFSCVDLSRGNDERTINYDLVVEKLLDLRKLSIDTLAESVK